MNKEFKTETRKLHISHFITADKMDIKNTAGSLVHKAGYILAGALGMIILYILTAALMCLCIYIIVFTFYVLVWIINSDTKWMSHPINK